MTGRTRCQSPAPGYTVLEVVIAIFIFGCVSASLFTLIMQTDRIRGRARYLEVCTRLAAGEAERLRSCAAQNAVVEDSMYTTDSGERTITVRRTVITPEAPPSYLPQPREPVAVEIMVADEQNLNPAYPPLRFKLLIGQENP